MFVLKQGRGSSLRILRPVSVSQQLIPTLNYTAHVYVNSADSKLFVISDMCQEVPY